MMVIEDGDHSKPAAKQDPEYRYVGRILMNLPPLFNVLVGDMSIAEPHANHAFAENLKHSRFRKHTQNVW
jgi:hypothetical protein